MKEISSSVIGVGSSKVRHSFSLSFRKNQSLCTAALHQENLITGLLVVKRRYQLGLLSRWKGENEA